MHQDENDNTIACHIGTRVRKNHTSKRGAFQTIGDDPAFIIAEGKIDTLRRFKDDVTEVKAGFECGMRLDSFDKYEEGDVIETFEIDKIRPTL